MKERPILFSGPMVKAILDGRKSQTRRIVKKVPEIMNQRNEWCVPLPSPYGVVGNSLWVRETGWERPERTPKMMREGADTWAKYYYDADGYDTDADREQFKAWGFKRRPSIFMPRWASRITLEITEVRVQRLQDVSEEDAKAEGCEASPHGTWWMGYRDCGGTIGMNHELHRGDTPPAWMIDPRKDIPRPWLDRTSKSRFEVLWQSINAKRAPWATNPWVWAVSFKRL